MKRFKGLRTWMGAVTAIALLAAWPAMVGADEGGETVIPPEMNWTATPPASHYVDGGQLVEFLLKKGIISPQDLAMLERGEVAHAKASTQPCAPARTVSR